MNTRELSSAATAAYGPSWRIPLAKALGRSREMIYHYERGNYPIPDALAVDIRKVCKGAIEKRMHDLSQALLMLELL